MSNANTSLIWNDLPVQTLTTGTETALLVPTSAQNYGTLPSPAFAAGAGLTLGWPPDINPGAAAYDGHPFKVRVAGRATTAGSYTFQFKLYEVPGSIIAAGTQATLSNDHVVVSLAATTIATATDNFLVEAEFFWDSTTKALTGFVTAAQIEGVNIAPNSGTAGTNVATTVVTSVTSADLNFIPSVTFGTAGANSFQITEFAIDRA
jgi:hypothetical protein